MGLPQAKPDAGLVPTNGASNRDEAPTPRRRAGPLDSYAPRLVVALLIFQIVCAVIFLFDVSSDLFEAGWSMISDLHLLPELLAVLGLGISIVFVGLVLRRMLQRQRQLEKGMSVATGALSSLMEGYFQSWGLTPSEQAVATYTIKGYSIAEIAGLRGSAEGTVKTHLNAIYRKAEVSGRAQLVSLLVEDLLRDALVVAGDDNTALTA